MDVKCDPVASPLSSQAKGAHESSPQLPQLCYVPAEMPSFHPSVVQHQDKDEADIHDMLDIDPADLDQLIDMALMVEDTEVPGIDYRSKSAPWAAEEAGAPFMPSTFPLGSWGHQLSPSSHHCFQANWAAPFQA